MSFWGLSPKKPATVASNYLAMVLKVATGGALSDFSTLERYPFE
jgi:hypothetical protein